MEAIQIRGFTREKSGKEAAKKLRRDGFIPAIVYSKDTNMAVKVPVTELKTLRVHHFSESSLVKIKIEDSRNEEIVSVIKDVQFHPLTEKVIHIDFLRVSMENKIRVKVPVILKGEVKGAKEGGIPEHLLREIEIEAFPVDLPERIEVDISALETGHSLHVGALDLGEKIKIIDSPEETIVTVIAKEEVPVEEEAVPEEAAGEPEVIKEKKPTEGSS